MAAPAPAEIALVHYVDDVPYHQRLILAWVTDTEYVVATPDFDLFIEQLDFTNPALDGLRLPGAGQAMGVGAGNVYTFAAIPDGTERAALVQEGARMAAMERVRRGLPPVPGVQGRSEPEELGRDLPLLFPSLDLGCQPGSSFPRRQDRRRLDLRAAPQVLQQHGSGSSACPCSSCSSCSRWRVSAGGRDLGPGRADGQPRHW